MAKKTAAAAFPDNYGQTVNTLNELIIDLESHSEESAIY